MMSKGALINPDYLIRPGTITVNQSRAEPIEKPQLLGRSSPTSFAMLQKCEAENGGQFLNDVKLDDLLWEPDISDRCVPPALWINGISGERCPLLDNAGSTLAGVNPAS